MSIKMELILFNLGIKSTGLQRLGDVINCTLAFDRKDVPDAWIDITI